MNTKIRYSVIIPAYNEEAVIQETYRRLSQVMRTLDEPYELLFVNDGSRDRTAEIIESVAVNDESVYLLDLSRNFGHQAAISAGMDYARGDAVIIIDADLQDPPELIPNMIELWKEGYEVVYARRSVRQGESWFKKQSAAAFYRILRRLTDINIPLDTGDFRLIDRKVCAAMRGLHEQNRFVRGLVSWVGFKQTAIEYVREERFAGESKYSLRKMLNLSLDGIVSFSQKPLKLATYTGLTISLASLIYLLIYLGQILLGSSSVSGWVPLLICMFFLNGVILIILGIQGEYIGRIYDECKDRPLYLLRNQPGLETTGAKEVKWIVQK